MFLIDTNICISAMKGQSSRLNQMLMTIHPAEIAVSSVTVFELEFGAAKSNWSEKTREQMRFFLSPFQILHFDAKDASYAGTIRAYLEKQGTKIGPYDTLIAGQGLARNLTVVTHNTGEFSRVPGLLLTDWV